MGQEILSEGQNASFDQEYFQRDDLEWLIAELRKYFERPIRALDVGGGNGAFLDKLITAGVVSDAVNIDLSAHLLTKNKQNKKLINASILEHSFKDGEKFDFISLNWVLHHMVGASDSECESLQSEVIAKCRSLLTERGLLLVSENDYRSWLTSDFSAKLIYLLTRSRRLAPFLRRFANTAGVGVRFRTARDWIARCSPMHIIASQYGLKWQTSAYKRLLLGMRSPRHVHILLAGRRD